VRKDGGGGPGVVVEAKVRGRGNKEENTEKARLLSSNEGAGGTNQG